MIKRRIHRDIPACVYILRLQKPTNLREGGPQLYIGMTTNPLRRFWEHATKQKGAIETKMYGFQQVLYVQWYPSIKQALRAESQMKRKVKVGYIPEESFCCFILPSILKRLPYRMVGALKP